MKSAEEGVVQTGAKTEKQPTVERLVTLAMKVAGGVITPKDIPRLPDDLLELLPRYMSKGDQIWCFRNWKTFYASGNLKEEGNFVEESKDKLLWESVVYHDTKTKTKLRSESARYYNDDDTKPRKRLCRGDRRQLGFRFSTISHVRFYPSGAKEGVGDFRNGKPVGKHEEFYENGHLKVSGHFNEDGEQHGTWFQYGTNGALIGSMEFVRGEEHGWSHLYRDGSKFYSLYKEKGVVVDPPTERATAPKRKTRATTRKKAQARKRRKR